MTDPFRKQAQYPRDGTHVVMGRFNKPPDDRFKERMRQVCMRPAMYLGEESYEMLTTFLDGLALGFQDWQGSFMHSFLHEEFQQFLAKKYKRRNRSYENEPWGRIIPLALKAERPRLTQKQMIDRLWQDFEDFDNILVRMSVETGEDDGNPS